MLFTVIHGGNNHHRLVGLLCQGGWKNEPTQFSTCDDQSGWHTKLTKEDGQEEKKCLSPFEAVVNAVKDTDSGVTYPDLAHQVAAEMLKFFHSSG